MKLSRRVKVLFIVVLVCGGLLGAVYAGVYGWIQWDAHKKAKTIWMTDYPQAADEIEALIMRMQLEDCRMKDRNMAVWALGRLADERALEALKQEYTGRPCEHDKFLCQYELQKAICRCGGKMKNTPDCSP